MFDLRLSWKPNSPRAQPWAGFGIACATALVSAVRQQTKPERGLLYVALSDNIWCPFRYGIGAGALVEPTNSELYFYAVGKIWHMLHAQSLTGVSRGKFLMAPDDGPWRFKTPLNRVRLVVCAVEALQGVALVASLAQRICL